MVSLVGGHSLFFYAFFDENVVAHATAKQILEFAFEKDRFLLTNVSPFGIILLSRTIRGVIHE